MARPARRRNKARAARLNRVDLAMAEALTRCTECGAAVRNDASTCPRCRYPRWYTLKKVAICLLVVGLLIGLTKYLMMFGDRTLALWFGPS